MDAVHEREYVGPVYILMDPVHGLDGFHGPGVHVLYFPAKHSKQDRGQKKLFDSKFNFLIARSTSSLFSACRLGLLFCTLLSELSHQRHTNVKSCPRIKRSFHGLLASAS